MLFALCSLIITIIVDFTFTLHEMFKTKITKRKVLKLGWDVLFIIICTIYLLKFV